MKPSAQDRTWIVLADASRARIHLADKQLTRSSLLREMEHPESRAKGIDLVSTARGRTKNRLASDPRRAAMEPTMTAREAEVLAFAREIARELEHGRTHNAFDELIIAAPPQFLGQLRDALSAPLRAMVRADIPKRLTDVADRDVIGRVQAGLLDAGAP